MTTMRCGEVHPCAALLFKQPRMPISAVKMSIATARPIAIPRQRPQVPPTPPQTWQARPNTLAASVSLRPGLDAEESLRLVSQLGTISVPPSHRATQDIADLTARLTALGETDLPSTPLSPTMARAVAFHQATLSPPPSDSFFGSPRAPGLLSLDQLTRSPPVLESTVRVGSPPSCQPRDRQMAFSLLSESLYDSANLGSSPASVPQALFSLPSVRSQPKERSPRPAPSAAALPSSPAPKAVRGFQIACSPPAQEAAFVPSPASLPPIREHGATDGGKGTQFDDADEQDSWLCAACDERHSGEDEASVVIRPCGTMACAPALRTRLHNGGIAMCPRCSGTAAHRAYRRDKLAIRALDFQQD
jgi:hypothetical protein